MIKVLEWDTDFIKKSKRHTLWMNLYRALRILVLLLAPFSPAGARFVGISVNHNPYWAIGIFFCTLAMLSILEHAVWTLKHRSRRRLLFGILNTVPMLIILSLATMLLWLMSNRHIFLAIPAWWATGFLLALARYAARKWALAEAVLHTKDYKLFGRITTRFLKRVKHDEASLFDLPEKSAFESYTVMTLPSDWPEIYVGAAARSTLDPDELRTVIAHELGHSWSQHYVGFELSDWIRRMFLVPALLSIASECLANAPQWMEGNRIVFFLATITLCWQINTWAMYLLHRPRELGADLYAIEVTNTPAAFVEALTKLSHAQPYNVFPNILDTLGLFSHPCTLKRLKHLAATCDTSGPHRQIRRRKLESD